MTTQILWIFKIFYFTPNHNSFLTLTAFQLLS